MGNEDKYAQYPERAGESRLRYFDGQFLGSQDFIDEQRYHIDRMRRHTRHLRLRGVTDGLGVGATGVLKVKVEPGTAIDDKGRQLVLSAARELTLPADTPRPGKYVLYVVFAEKSDRTLGGTADQQGTRGDTRFREDPQLGAYPHDGAAPPSAVGLALLTVDGAGAVVVSTPPEQRVYSGVRLPGPGDGGPTLGTGGDLRPQELVVGGGLRVQGGLSVRDGIIQNGATPVGGTAELGLYSQTPGAAVRLVNQGGSFNFFHDGGVGAKKTHELHADGNVTLGWPRNPLRISGVWTGFADGSNKAEISNDTDAFKCLMIVGNGVSGAGRVVGVWDQLNVHGKARVAQTLSVANNAGTRTLQIGGDTNGVGIDPSDASPNAGYVRFGDNTGWRLHFARSRESPNAAPSQGPTGIVMTVHDHGQVSVGTPNPSGQVRLRVHGPSVADQWCGRLVAGGEKSVVVAGELNGQAWLGAHNPGLNAWTDLMINPGGKVAIACSNPESAALTVQGITVLRTGGVGGWDRLVVTTTSNWGDGDNQHVTLGAGGAGGIMLSNPHVSWRDGRAAIRYGRVGGVTGGTYWELGLRADGSFGLVPFDGGADGVDKLRIERTGAARFTSTLLVGSNGAPEAGAALTVDGMTVIRTGGTGGWDRLVVTTTRDWGNGDNQHVTLGAGGAGGIMLSNPHVSWRDGKAAIRYGRTGGVIGGNFWDVGVRADGSFSLIPYEGGADGAEKLKIDRTGAARFTSTLLVGSNAAPEAGAALTVDGRAVIRTGGAGGWDRLVITTTKEWGDGDAQYVTLGAGGAAGIMLSSPHVTWRDNRASIRYGRTAGAAGNTYWDAGVRDDGSFSIIPYDNNPGNGAERLKLERTGEVTLGGRAPLRFSHAWTGFPDDAVRGGSEISNDIDTYKCLMVIGNKAAGAERRVGLWDRVDVNGFLQINQTGGGGALRITNFTDRNVYMNIMYEGGNNTCIFYHQNGLGNFMRQDGAWNRNSDRALKRDLTPLDDALALAMQLRPVRFTWKATGTPCLGLIAQEVLPVFPELVSESTRTGEDGQPLLGLKYDAFGVVAIAAVQQLKHQLEAKIAALDAQLRELATADRR